MLTAINTICGKFFRICLLQCNPQDLPASWLLLTICFVSYTAANILLALRKVTLIMALQAGVLESVLVIALTLVILRLSRHEQRWVQTLMALAGTGCIMSFLALPIFYGSAYAGADALLGTILFLLYLGLLVWNITVMAHVLRHALDTTFFFGAIFALTYILITSMLIDFVIPELAVV